MSNYVKKKKNELSIKTNKMGIGYQKTLRGIMTIPMIIIKFLKNISFPVGLLGGIALYVFMFADANDLKFFDAIKPMLNDGRNIAFALAIGACIGAILFVATYFIYRIVFTADANIMSSILDKESLVAMAERENQNYDFMDKYGSMENYEKAEMERYRQSVNYIER